MVPEERTAVLLGYDVEVMMKKSPDNSYPEALLGTGDCRSVNRLIVAVGETMIPDKVEIEV